MTASPAARNSATRPAAGAAARSGGANAVACTAEIASWSSGSRVAATRWQRHRRHRGQARALLEELDPKGRPVPLLGRGGDRTRRGELPASPPEAGRASDRDGGDGGVRGDRAGRAGAAGVAGVAGPAGRCRDQAGAGRVPGCPEGVVDIVAAAWKAQVFPKGRPEGTVDRNGYVFCVLEAFHTRLKRRDTYAVASSRWADPRAQLLAGLAWEAKKETLLDSLQLAATPRICWPSTRRCWTPRGGTPPTRPGPGTCGSTPTAGCTPPPCRRPGAGITDGSRRSGARSRAVAARGAADSGCAGRCGSAPDIRPRLGPPMIRWAARSVMPTRSATSRWRTPGSRQRTAARDG